MILEEITQDVSNRSSRKVIISSQFEEETINREIRAQIKTVAKKNILSSKKPLNQKKEILFVIRNI